MEIIVVVVIRLRASFTKDYYKLMIEAAATRANGQAGPLLEYESASTCHKSCLEHSRKAGMLKFADFLRRELREKTE